MARKRNLSDKEIDRSIAALDLQVARLTDERRRLRAERMRLYYLRRWRARQDMLHVKQPAGRVEEASR